MSRIRSQCGEEGEYGRCVEVCDRRQWLVVERVAGLFVDEEDLNRKVGVDERFKDDLTGQQRPGELEATSGESRLLACTKRVRNGAVDGDLRVDEMDTPWNQSGERFFGDVGVDVGPLGGDVSAVMSCHSSRQLSYACTSSSMNSRRTLPFGSES